MHTDCTDITNKATMLDQTAVNLGAKRGRAVLAEVVVAEVEDMTPVADLACLPPVESQPLDNVR